MGNTQGVRMFTVLVARPGQKALVYPEQSGEKALASMLVLKGRGHEPIARTTANGITEDLSVDDMQTIYLDESKATNRAIDSLKKSGMQVKPGALLPFINLSHPGQMFKWDGPVDQEAVQIAQAKAVLLQDGFDVEFADLQDKVIHAYERPRG